MLYVDSHLIADSPCSEDEDEESIEWERAQIRRAGPVMEEPAKKPTQVCLFLFLN
jgi:hypothetical protein